MKRKNCCKRKRADGGHPSPLAEPGTCRENKRAKGGTTNKSSTQQKKEGLSRAATAASKSEELLSGSMEEVPTVPPSLDQQTPGDDDESNDWCCREPPLGSLSLSTSCTILLVLCFFGLTCTSVELTALRLLAVAEC